MKKFILLSLASFTALTIFAADPRVDEKILKAFALTFPNAAETSWTVLPQAFEVSFKQNQVRATITYDMEGNITKTLRYYGEEQLPIMVLTKVRSRFADKKIFGVVEEFSEEGTYYHITLVDDTHWIKLRADAYGAITVEDKFKKA